MKPIAHEGSVGCAFEKISFGMLLSGKFDLGDLASDVPHVKAPERPIAPTEQLRKPNLEIQKKPGIAPAPTRQHIVIGAHPVRTTAAGDRHGVKPSFHRVECQGFYPRIQGDEEVLRRSELSPVGPRRVAYSCPAFPRYWEIVIGFWFRSRSLADIAAQKSPRPLIERRNLFVRNGPTGVRNIISRFEIYIVQLNALPAPPLGRAAKSGRRSDLVCRVMDIVSYIEPGLVSLRSFRLFRPGLEKQRSHAAPAQFQRSGNADGARTHDTHVEHLLKNL
ncbi:hypothetical protein QDY28_29185 [Rhizobium sp. BR 362]